MLLQYFSQYKAFVFRCHFSAREIPKEAGFIWDRIVQKNWATYDVGVAQQLLEFATPATRTIIENTLDKRSVSIVESRAVSANVVIPCPQGLGYLPYQKVAIIVGLRKLGVLLADEMGLGKTIEAIGILNADKRMHRILVITKNSLKINWARELTKWLLRRIPITLVEKTFPTTGIAILNYQRLHKWRQQLRSCVWDAVIIDEAHNLVNPRAKQTKAVFGSKTEDPVQGLRRILITGTPIVNTPHEIWTLLHYINPQMWPEFFPFVKQYDMLSYDGFGYRFGQFDVNDPEQIADRDRKLEALQRELRGTVMVRRLKSEVYKELPEIRYQVIEIPWPKNIGNLIHKELDITNVVIKLRHALQQAKISKNSKAYEKAVFQLQDYQSSSKDVLATVRRELSELKLPLVIQHIEETLVETNKVVVFGHHRAFLEALLKKFKPSGFELVYGGIPNDVRQKSVDRFQTDPNCRGFLGSYRSAGEGLTLTASELIILPEFDWTPGIVDQAIARVHRIGQLGAVLAQLLVLQGSFDAYIAKRFIAKRQVIFKALDKMEGR